MARNSQFAEQPIELVDSADALPAAVAGLGAADDAKWRTAGKLLFIGFWTASIILTGLLLWAPLSREAVGAMILAMTVCMMMAGVHIAVSMTLPGLLGIWILGGERSFVYAMEHLPRSTAASWSLSVIPMFILMGLVISQSGIATKVFDAAKQWIGWIPGGLGVATVLTGAGLSAASGSTLGVAYATSRIGLPEMLRVGYKPRMATGIVAVSGVLKMLIPPSLTVVIYAGIAGTPVGPQLMAGLIPGLVLAGLFVMLIIFRAKLDPSLAPAIDTSAYTWKSRFKALLEAWPVFLLVVIVVGGIYSGLTTATEAGALSALATIVVTGIFSRKDGLVPFLKFIGTAFLHTIGSVASIMFLLISVSILTLAVSLSGAVNRVTEALVGVGLSKYEFLLILVVMYVIMGMLMDELAMMLLTVPILLPVLTEFEIDKIWFGVFVILLCEVGMIVPPVGLLAFVVHGIAQRPEVNLGHKISLMDVFRGVFWFVVVTIGLIVFLIFFPDLALWLPNNINS